MEEWTREQWDEWVALHWPAGLVVLEEMPGDDHPAYRHFREDLESGALEVPDDDSGLLDFNTGERPE